jgi:hypothetical protein
LRRSWPGRSLAEAVQPTAVIANSLKTEVAVGKPGPVYGLVDFGVGATNCSPAHVSGCSLVIRPALPIGFATQSDFTIYA